MAHNEQVLQLLKAQDDLTEWFKSRNLSHSQAMNVIAMFVAISVESEKNSNARNAQFFLMVQRARGVIQDALTSKKDATPR